MVDRARRRALAGALRSAAVVALLEGSVAPAWAGGDVDGETIVLENAHELFLDEDGLGGPGMDLLMEEVADAQFVVLGEPHNTRQVDELTAELFRVLHERLGFGHLIVEQDASIMDCLAEPPARGDLEAVRERARLHPRALHFRSDAELFLLAEVGRISEAPEPLWGVDRVFDAELALEDVAEGPLAEGDRPRVSRVLEEARAFRGEQFFLTSDSPALESLLAELRLPRGTRAAEILDALRVSRADLLDYQTEHDDGDPWGYRANLRREELMKTRFLAHYRAAVASGEAVPKALAKLGHWHAGAGRNAGRVRSLGGFLVDVARFNDRKAVSIAIQPVNVAGRHWTITDYPDYALFFCVADPEGWSLVDLRPLRGYVHTGAIAVSEDVERMIFGFDFLLLMGGTDPAQATWQESER